MASDYYLLKTEPTGYSFADLQRDSVTEWDGVSNPVALRNLREMKPGAQLIIGAQDLVRAAQRVDGRQVEGVALSGAANPDEQHVSVALHGDGLSQLHSRMVGGRWPIRDACW